MASNLRAMASKKDKKEVWLLVPSVFLVLVVRPGAPSSVLAPSSDAPCSVRSLLFLLILVSTSFLLLVVRHLLLVAMPLFLWVNDVSEMM